MTRKPGQLKEVGDGPNFLQMAERLYPNGGVKPKKPRPGIASNKRTTLTAAGQREVALRSTPEKPPAHGAQRTVPTALPKRGTVVNGVGHVLKR
jgi:hypothetical protein